jgi:hypothetical protein
MAVMSCSFCVTVEIVSALPGNAFPDRTAQLPEAGGQVLPDGR